MSQCKGIFEVYELAIVGGLIIGVLLLFITLGFLSNVFGIKGTVNLAVKIDDQGSRLNSFLRAGNGMEALGNAAAGETDAGVESRLVVLRWSMRVRDSDGTVLKKWGNPVRKTGVDVPLPGMRQGSIEVDVL